MKMLSILALTFCTLFATLSFAADAGVAVATEPVAVTEAVVVDGGTPAPAGADADAVIDDAIAPIDKDPGSAISSIKTAFEEGRWATAIGLLVMFLIWVLRRFIWKLIPSNALPWVTLALGCAVTTSTELIAGIVWWKALIDGLLTGASAMALWSTVFKHFMNTEKPEA